MDKDNIHITHVIIQCGFNNVKKEKHSRDILAKYFECLDKIKEKFPNAIILVGEIIKHPFSENMNGKIQIINNSLKEDFPNLDGEIRLVEHPILNGTPTRNLLFDGDKIHVNLKGTLKLLSDSYRVEKEKSPFKESRKIQGLNSRFNGHGRSKRNRQTARSTWNHYRNHHKTEEIMTRTYV